MHQQCNIIAGSSLMVPEPNQSLLACICIVVTVTVSLSSSHGHHNSWVLVLSAFEDCGAFVFFISCVVAAVVIVAHTHLKFEQVQAFALWIPGEMYRVPTSTTSGNFCYKFKPDRASIVNFQAPAIHSSFLSFFIKNDF